MKIERELMRGAGPVAVLKLLEGGRMYGYEIVAALAERSDGVLAMGQSTLYPMLYNLEAQGLVRSERVRSESGRQRKYYALTAQGKKRLAHDTAQWEAVSAAMSALGILTSCAALNINVTNWDAANWDAVTQSSTNGPAVAWGGTA
ncbi:MAG: helix-turn-helix transcriptional regulator [Planctomycetales bacterium]|nr:helix-turn-helix transcriptional regulator [Planctomycetales bacterium]